MDALTSLGLILLLALLAGHLVKTLRIPEVTGYILVGIALGPSILGWVSTDNLAALEVLSQVALGLILFSVGSVFEVFQVPAHGPGSSSLSRSPSRCWRPFSWGLVSSPSANRGRSPSSWVRSPWRRRQPRR